MKNIAYYSAVLLLLASAEQASALTYSATPYENQGGGLTTEMMNSGGTGYTATFPDGSKEVGVDRQDGTTAVTRTDPDGNQQPTETVQF